MRDFLNLDLQGIQEEAISYFESVVGEYLFAGDERRILINTMVGITINALAKVNKLFNMDFPQYAVGTYLDEIGAGKGLTRLAAQPAVVTLQYTLSAIQPVDITVPAGTRATPDGKHFYATVEDLIIPAGQLTGTIKAQATVTGSAHNGFLVGTIVNQVDLVPFVASVTNIDVPQGGAEIESDESYRQRIMLSPAAVSTAGAELSYIYWAKSADSTIMDVAVTSPNAGEVVITILLNDGQIPGQPVLDRVTAVLSSKNIRPLTDQITVQAPTPVTYSINVDYFIDANRESEITEIQAAVEAAIEEYIKWQGGALGRHINPDVLKQKILNAGAIRATVVAPIFTELDPDQLATLSGTPNITYNGLI